jgi:antitoxin ParD1/3/4
MATLNVRLDEALGRFVEDRVASGEFLDAGEVVRAGLSLLKRRAERQQRKLARLNALIQEGLDDLEAGRFTEVTDLSAWFDSLEAEVDANATSSLA